MDLLAFLLAFLPHNFRMHIFCPLLHEFRVGVCLSGEVLFELHEELITGHNCRFLPFDYCVGNEKAARYSAYEAHCSALKASVVDIATNGLQKGERWIDGTDSCVGYGHGSHAEDAAH